MAQRIKVKGRIKDMEVKQTSDYEGKQHQEAKVTFVTNAKPKAPNKPNYTINKPSYAINRPRQPNGIRYDAGDKHAKAQTDNKQTEA